MYSERARQLRRCTATTKAGRPCRAFACWDDPEQRCAIHAGRGHRGPLASRWPQDRRPARYVPCRCAAYAWPHRPGSGWCRWPDPPLGRCTNPAGTRGAFAMRRRVRRGRVTYERR
ncbi:MAG TPA: hypothetical protein VFL91_04925 [Thermomicrobiales bacterium]|nr:hypothetical protein [Thermomicrobiales bacterium]